LESHLYVALPDGRGEDFKIIFKIDLPPGTKITVGFEKNVKIV
jgi:hypothetical protein